MDYPENAIKVINDRPLLQPATTFFNKTMGKSTS